MFNAKRFVPVAILSAGLVAGIVSLARAEAAKETKPAAAQPEMKLPPGWSEEDMKSCMDAATPGKMHERLTKDAGVWTGKTTMWMYPGAEPVKSECTETVTPILDGRFVKVEFSGDMPGMGPFNGFGVYGFDNNTKEFVSTWMDSCSTSMAYGTGKVSTDGKTITYTRSSYCPVANKPITFHEVETVTGPNTKTMEITGPDPKSGKEYKMFSVELTKKS